MKYYLLLSNGEIQEDEAKNICETPKVLGSRSVLAAGSTRTVVEAVKTIILSEDEYYIGVDLNDLTPMREEAIHAEASP